MAFAGSVRTDRPRFPGRTVAGFGLVDLVVGVLLSVAVFVLVHVDLYASDPHGNVINALVATSMTLPVVWARRYPMLAAATVATGAVVNWLFVGQYVRCGAAVPAALWLACVMGLELRGRRALIAMVLVLVDIQALCLADAALIPASTIPLAPVAIAFWFAGRTIRSRNDTVRRLAVQNEHLVTTRQRTAELAVDNERRRISQGLDEHLQRSIGDLASTAAFGREQLDDPPAAQDAFAAIASGGRETLARMRDVVHELRTDAPREPQPDLARLGDLVSRAGAVLTVDGQPHALPSAVEVSGYRVVEQLLHTFPSAVETVAVHVHFGADQLELRVTGQQVAEPTGPEVSLARHRLESHGGSLIARHRADQLEWVARFPLMAG